MRRARASLAVRVAALAATLLVMTWGVGATMSDAQGHHDDHGSHDTTTTTGGPGTTTTTQPRPTNPGTQTGNSRYGPYTIQGATPGPDGHAHAHSGNRFALNVQKPCTDCYITSMKAKLVREDGTEVGINEGPQLHHMVLFNTQAGRTDATCPTGLGWLGQRFFASGDERTMHDLPTGYGYRVTGDSRWNLIYDMGNYSEQPQTVYYQVDFEWVPASTPGMTDVEPVWLDIAQCGTSEFSVPAGPASRTYTWTVNRPGDLLYINGHLHDYGVNQVVRNDTTGEVICDARAGYGETPMYVDGHGEEHISSMSYCGGRGATEPVTSLETGQRVTITSHYDAPTAQDGVMGISVGYIAQGGGTGTPGAGCQAATNSAHVQAGRATTWLIFAWAKGSNDYLGLTFATTSLREDPAGTWSLVDAC
jgi:hypothetical protein